MHRPGARGHTFPASCDGRTRSFLHIKYTFQSANARSQQRVAPGRETERKGAFRPLPEFPGLGGEPAGPCAPLGPPPAAPPPPGTRRRGRGGRTGGSPPGCLRPSCHARQADAPRRRAPARPFPLPDILYNNSSGSERKQRALPGPSPRGTRCWRPRPPAPARSARERGFPAGEEPERRLGGSLLGEGAAAVAGPRQEAASVTNCVSFFKHISWSPSSPGAGRPGGGAAAAAGRKPSERRKFLGPSLRPPRARSRRAARRPAPMSGWATCDPREPGRPLLPAGLARSRGLPDPAGNGDVRNFPGPRRAEPPPAPRTSPLPCSPEATIRAGGAGRVVRERARAWGGR